MTLGSSWEEARWGLVAYLGSASLLAASGAAAIIASLVVTTLMSGHGLAPALHLTAGAMLGGDFGLDWGPYAISPARLSMWGLVELFRLLVEVTLGAFAVAGITALAVGAARGSARAGELTVRRAVGAGRRRLARVALLEGATIAIGAAFVGVSGGALCGSIARHAWPGTVSGVSLAPSGLAIAVALGAVVGGALVPIALIRRPGPLTDASAPGLTLAIPVAQLGMGLTILTVGGVIGHNARPLPSAREPRGDARTVLEFSSVASSRSARAAGYGALLAAFESDDSASVGALMSPGTLAGFGSEDRVLTECGHCYICGGGACVLMPWHPVRVSYFAVGPCVFSALGIPVLAGRGIELSDRWDAPPVAVVSATLARKHFQDGDAVGRRIRIGSGESRRWYRVVGVVPDRPAIGLGSGFTVPDAVYLSIQQVPPRAVRMLVTNPRARSRAERLVRSIAESSVIHRTTRAAILHARVAPLSWFAPMFAAEGWATLVIAAIGAFAIMRLWVTSRLRDLGVYRAVGAKRAALIRFVIWRVLLISVLGVAAGLWAALFAWDVLRAVLGDVPPWSYVVVARAAPALVLATLAGALEPAWRAAHAVPADLLNAE